MITVLDLKDIDYNSLSCLYFYANWLLPNKEIVKMIEKFEEKSKSIIFYGIDCDSFPHLPKALAIKEIPGFVYFYNEKEIGRFTGITLTKGFNTFCNNILKGINEK